MFVDLVEMTFKKFQMLANVHFMTF